MDDYTCTSCGIAGYRLYRPYQICADRLLCAKCAEVDQKRTIKPEEPDQVGWYVAAIPDGLGNFWGFTSVPAERVVWWYSMPLRPSQTSEERVSELLRVCQSMASSATFFLDRYNALLREKSAEETR